jgi:uncharacterized protein with HEPN domain
MQRDDALLLHILLATRKIRRHTNGKSFEDFLTNELLQDSVIRQIGIIGEAAGKISKGFRESHPTIPWSDMTGMRHKVVHDYMRINLRKVWDTSQLSVPQLISLIEPLVPPEE